MSSLDNILDTAQVDWQDGIPFSTGFNDIYFSREDGQRESVYTFIEGNQLETRWQKLAHDEFQILELGFGTGLNFFSTVNYWQSFHDQQRWLNYHSIEKHPLKRMDFIKAANCWPELQTFSQVIIEHYPLPLRGTFKISFPEHFANLYLHYDDASAVLEHLIDEHIGFDAFYLDGFAPAKNPDAWNEKLAGMLAALSNPQASFATFTAAGFVRRAMQSNGFSVSKRKGFGTKREMLVGVKADIESSPPYPELSPIWFKRPVPVAKKEKVAIIGAGIAGCATAYELSQAGFDVTVYESSDNVATGGSASEAGIVYPFVSKDLNPQSLFYLQAYWLLINRIKHLNMDSIFRQCGVIKLSSDNTFEALATQLETADSAVLDWLAPWRLTEPLTTTTQPLKSFGLNFPSSGVVNIKSLCATLIEHSNARLELTALVDDLTFADGQWTLSYNQRSEQFTAVIMCAAHHSKHLLPPHFLPANQVRGQTARVPSKPEQQLPTIFCDSHYCIPRGDHHYIGASFEVNDKNPEYSEDSHQQLIAQVAAMFSQCDWPFEQAQFGRVGHRHCTVDRLPYVGPLVKLAEAMRHYDELWKGKRHQKFSAADYWPNLYLNIGHGTRGVTSSWLSAALIRAYLEGSAAPLDSRLRQRLHPSRAIIRECRKAPDQRLPFLQSYSD
ncbi:MAG: bifunctional tRNA (5-methylaminomethyl-2-thiouridine)(34)-methyltransferase MnmD/FAD-dependent 5-carboxymethylaminomethyl-2-thiouridine(34) oxidoreductase MnmC [Gammaproteobacteria bacterium]|nr:bifunctional tRNA (5-methylaminomethyl-2-thiouridine)(34)-methyltransferase MnmD/FAD-dependent 5-carboxymethylaminomethyl-2-thiouridine(34) oxidoreductase MnmC [Gammaproteobacteria bacterium]